MLKASVCTIGDEILIGQITDTNSSEIARSLGELGIRVTRMVSIGDDRNQIISSLENELKDNDIVITTGGLGPTKDDITKEALAALSGAKGYKRDERQLAIIHKILSARGLDVLDINRDQALVPDTCDVIPNKIGTAPVMAFRMDPTRFGHPATLYAMPGVPFETKAALPDVLADIKAHTSFSNISHHSIMVYGIAESALSKKIASWEDSLPSDMHLAYLPDPHTGVRLRLSIFGGTAEDDKARMDAEIVKLGEILGDAIYSYEDDTLEHALGVLLRKHGKTLATAESCTGGDIAHMITTVPGSSEYFLGSVVSYAVSVKENVLGVPAETIEKYGVVSSETAAAMAQGARRTIGADYAVSTTGLAGPGGDGTNPEGTVWVGIAGPDWTLTKKYNYHNDRKRNIQRFASSALYFLLTNLRKKLD